MKKADYLHSLEDGHRMITFRMPIPLLDRLKIAQAQAKAVTGKKPTQNSMLCGLIYQGLLSLEGDAPVEPPNPAQLEIQ